jgi:glutathione S-transferase
VGELGLPHERIDVGGSFGKNNEPAYLAMNPNALVPTLEEDGFVLWESNAIVRYLAGKYGAGTLEPAEARARARANSWMDWQLTVAHPPLTPVFWGLVRTPPEKRDNAAIKAAGDKLGATWSLLDAHLAKRAFVAGNDFTMGDIPIGCAFWRYSKLEVAKPRLAHCDAWHNRLLERPGFRQHVAMPLS